MGQNPLPRILALVVFPCLSALAVHFIWGRFAEAKLGHQIAIQCKASYVPPVGSGLKAYFTPYTGYNKFDQAICPLVAFFDVLINSPDTISFLTYTIGTSLPLVLIPNVESHRVGQSYLLTYPVVFGLLSQLATVGVVFPIYWLVFILTGGPKKSSKSPLRSFTQAHSEALIFGIIAGAVIPSVAMLILNDFHLTAIWQFYPALVSFAQITHFQLRSSSKDLGSGYNLMQILYIGTFMVSSSAHISTVGPIITDFAAVKQLLVPSIKSLPQHAELSAHLLQFLKWDVTFAYTSTALALLWYADNLRQLVAFVVWYTLAIPILGFGAAVMGVAIWKERMLG